MQQRPLLYITSPTFLREWQQEGSMAESTEESTEEGTAIFEKEVEQPIDDLIYRQLHFFSKPQKERRMLLFVLSNGERIYGAIEQLQEQRVMLDCFHDKRWIDVHEIVKIQHIK